MTSALFIAKLKDETDFIMCQMIIYLLNSSSYVIDYCLVNNYKLQIRGFNRICLSEINNKSYDVIFCFNYNKTNFKQNIPLIWFVSKDIITFWHIGIKNLRKIDKIFLITNGIEYNINKYFLNDLFFPITIYPIIFLNEHYKKIDSDYFKILINIKSDFYNISPLIDIICVLNKFPKAKIEIVSNDKICYQVNNLTNSKYLIVDPDNIDYSSFDLVIANREAAYNAVLSSTPCILVGDYGYGGIVNEDNIESFFQSFFNGREEGYIGEQIPLIFLKEDILDIMQDPNINKKSLAVSKKLKKIQTHKNQFLISNIDSTIRKHQISQEMLSTVKLVKNIFFYSEKLNEDKWIIKDKLDKYHYSITNNENEILSSFNRPIPIERVVNKYQKSFSLEDITAFIHYLLKQKILIIYE